MGAASLSSDPGGILSELNLHTRYRDVFKMKELREEMIKLLCEERLKIDKNTIYWYAMFRGAIQLQFSNILAGSLQISPRDVFRFYKWNGYLD